MSSSQKLKSLENHKQGIDSIIADLEKRRNQCNVIRCQVLGFSFQVLQVLGVRFQDIIAKTNSANRTQLYTQIDDYFTELD